MQDMGKIEAAAAAGNGRPDCLHIAARSAKRGHIIGETIMAGTIEQKLASLGISLPTPASPIANYVPFVRHGNLLVISGQLC
ncbi:MAG: hypothetical protein ACREQD_10495, partial [Candidatus Binataceae bacterium]